MDLGERAVQAWHRRVIFRSIVAGLRPVMTWGMRRHWSGAEHLPRSGGFVVCSNHLSYVDPLTLAHFLVDQGVTPRFLAKESLFGVPGLGALLRSTQQIPVRRGSADVAVAVDAAVAAVHAGECVVVYPDGTLTRDPQLWPMVGKTGAARIALATGCPVIPVAQWGVQQVMPPYAKVPRLLPRRIVQVWAGPAVDLSSYRARLPDRSSGEPIEPDAIDPVVARQATDAITEAITGVLADIRQERPPAHPMPRPCSGGEAT